MSVTVYTDNFDRADAASVGSPWAKIQPGGQILAINTNAAGLPPSPLFDNYTGMYVSTVSNDQFSKATFKNLVSALVNRWQFVVVRASGVGVNCYAAGYSGDYDLSRFYRILKFVDSADSSIAVSSQSAQAGDVVQLSVVGAQLTLTVNNIVILTVADVALAAGYPGLFLRHNTAGSFLDDWSGGDALPAQAFDNFNRAAIGSNWGTVGVGGFPTLVIISNQAGGTDTAFQSAYRALGAMTDQFGQVTLVHLATGSIGILARASLTAATWYIFAAEAGGSYGMSKLLANSLSSLPRLRLQAAVVGDVMRLEIVGTSIKAYVNGVKIVDTTDSDIASGFPGLIMNNGPASVAYFDNWSGGQMPQTKQIGPLPAYRPDML